MAVRIQCCELGALGEGGGLRRASAGTHLELESKLRACLVLGYPVLARCPDPLVLQGGLCRSRSTAWKRANPGGWPRLSSLQKWREDSPSFLRISVFRLLTYVYGADRRTGRMKSHLLQPSKRAKYMSPGIMPRSCLFSLEHLASPGIELTWEL